MNNGGISLNASPRERNGYGSAIGPASTKRRTHSSSTHVPQLCPRELFASSRHELAPPSFFGWLRCGCWSKPSAPSTSGAALIWRSDANLLGLGAPRSHIFPQMTADKPFIPHHPPGSPLRAAEAQRALAHHLPADRRELSGDRRSRRLAQSGAPPADDAVAGLDPQRHVGPGASGAHLRPAHLGGPAADRGGPQAVRRRAAGDRRPHRRRAPPDRGPAQDPAREVRRAGARRRRRDDLRPVGLRRRGPRRQAGEQAQARGVCAAGARQGAGGAGRRRPERREPRDRSARRSAAVEPHRGRQLSQRPHSRPDPARGPGQDGKGAGLAPRRSSTSSPRR